MHLRAVDVVVLGPNRELRGAQPSHVGARALILGPGAGRERGSVCLLRSRVVRGVHVDDKVENGGHASGDLALHAGGAHGDVLRGATAENLVILGVTLRHIAEAARDGHAD